MSIGCQKPSWRYAISWPSFARASKRLLLEHAVEPEVVLQHLRFEHEEPTVHVLVGLRLLPEPLHRAVGVQLDDAEARQRADGGHGGEPAVALVEREQRGDVDIGEPVPVGDHASLVPT